MLVLTRRVGEEIVIDGNIIVTLVAINGDKVRLGFTAPPSVCVDRREVHERRAAFPAGKESHPLPVEIPLTCDVVSTCKVYQGEII